MLRWWPGWGCVPRWSCRGPRTRRTEPPSAEHLVHEAPEPGLARFMAADHRVQRVVEVLGRMPADRRIATPDVAAGQTQSQVHPSGALAQAIDAAFVAVRRDVRRRRIQV